MALKVAKKHLGFTLVELLVVIAIIGLLSTIVIVSFGGVRTQARDAAIRANMAQMKKATELHWENGRTYVGANTRVDFLFAYNAIIAAGGGSYANNFSATAYCFSFTLPGGGSWCIDSNGVMGNSPPVCNAALLRCNAN